jgi:hypothetical protein
MIEKFKAADQKARQALVEATGKMAPKGRISATASQVAQVALQKAVAALTDGDVNLEVVKQDDGATLAPEAYTGLVGFQALMDQLVKNGVGEAKKYQIDATLAAADDERLVEAAQRIIAAGRDDSLAAAVKRIPAPAPEAPAAPPAPPAPAPNPAASAADAVTALQFKS